MSSFLNFQRANNNNVNIYNVNIQSWVENVIGDLFIYSFYSFSFHQMWLLYGLNSRYQKQI